MQEIVRSPKTAPLINPNPTTPPTKPLNPPPPPPTSQTYNPPSPPSYISAPTCHSPAMELPDVEAGYSGKAPAFARRRPTYRSLSASGSPYSPRSGRSYDARFEEAHHFLDACYLCKKQLSKNKDIFMYRGDTPFCSEDCRQEQIEMDEAREKSYGKPIKTSSSRSDAQSSASKKGHDYHVRTGTVVAG